MVERLDAAFGSHNRFREPEGRVSHAMAPAPNALRRKVGPSAAASGLGLYGQITAVVVSAPALVTVSSKHAPPGDFRMTP